jgi:hypothetical protein
MMRICDALARYSDNVVGLCHQIGRVRISAMLASDLF